MAEFQFDKQDPQKSISTDNAHVKVFPGKKIGNGKYGVVYAAKYFGADCVAKEMYKFVVAQAIEVSQTAFKKEVDMLKNFKHPNIVQLMTVCQREDTPDLPILVMEKMSITLSTFLINEHILHHKICILHGIVCGLYYLHNECSIIHRNLTANSILLSDDYTPKISDFGQAKVFEPSVKTLTKVPGDLSHMPPEALSDQPIYSYKLDIFSFGCIVIHTVTQEKPTPMYESYKQLSNGKYVPIPEVERRSEIIEKMTLPALQHLHDTVLYCLRDNPDDRPNAVDLQKTFQKMLNDTPLSTKHVQSKFSLIDELDSAQNQMEDMKEQVSNLRIEKKELDSHKMTLEQTVKDQQDRIYVLEEETKTLGTIYEIKREKSEGEIASYIKVCIIKLICIHTY